MRTILLAAVLASAAATGCSKDKADSHAQAEQFPTMTLDEVDKAVTANEATAIDCNGDKTRKKFGTVPGAVLVDDETFTEKDLPADKSRKLVFYCSGPT